MRTVQCVDKTSKAVVSDAQCRTARPPATGVMPSYSTCAQTWTPVSYGPYAESCSDRTTRTIEWQCLQARPDGTVPGTGCGTQPAATETVANYSGCSYSWTTTPGACVGDGVRAVTVACTRSGGSSMPTAVLKDYCSGQTAPATTKTDATCSTTKSTCAIRADQQVTSYTGIKGNHQIIYDDWYGTEQEAIVKAQQYCEGFADSRVCVGSSQIIGNTHRLNVTSVNASATLGNRIGDASNPYYFAGLCTPKQ
jgi:hypothetical protein